LHNFNKQHVIFWQNFTTTMHHLLAIKVPKFN